MTAVVVWSVDALVARLWSACRTHTGDVLPVFVGLDLQGDHARGRFEEAELRFLCGDLDDLEFAVKRAFRGTSWTPIIVHDFSAGNAWASIRFVRVSEVG